MASTFRETASDEPVFVEVLSAVETADKAGVMFVNKAGHFVFKWAGHAPTSDIVASYTGGYIRFPNFQTGVFLDSLMGQRTVRPHHLVHSSYRDVVEAKRYDRVRITFRNIFTGIKQDIHEQKAVDLYGAVGIEKSLYKGMELAVFIGGSVRYSGMPRTAMYHQDKLNFQFTGKAGLSVEDIGAIADRLRQVITLFTRKPCDPVIIEVGIKQKNGRYNHGTCEYSVPNTYADDNIDLKQAIYVEEDGKDFLSACIAALDNDVSIPAAQWFAYREAREGKYYLDTVMSNLLSCAESVFYLLPDSKGSAKRGEQYDKMLAILAEQPTTEVPKKLMDWLKRGKRDYEDPKAYADKIKTMMEYADFPTEDSEHFRKYLNQLRNELMHGKPRNWNTVIIKNGDEITEVPVSIGEVMHRLDSIVRKALIKWLVTGKAEK